ncbi:MAG: flagellar basal body L-ring protein FlgH [Caulobacteraceae bacterium]|nr:flagellar basal body L-ring protein FlgH [Caulobacteraceae bacterium]
MRSAAVLTTLITLGFGLSACASVKETVKGPSLSPTSKSVLQASQNTAPSVMASMSQTGQPIAQSTANSLWRPGARTFFNDQRANKVGDILTILISIDVSAKVSNSTDSSRTNSTQGGVANFFGLEQALGKIFPAGYDPAHMINQSGTTTSAGQGAVNRQEQINLTIAAVVTGVLPNGNLIIQGRQEVKTNNELRELTVGGIVRPEDISSANTIRHTQIAEARISYGGRGDVSAVQRTPVGTGLAQRWWPF